VEFPFFLDMNSYMDEKGATDENPAAANDAGISTETEEEVKQEATADFEEKADVIDTNGTPFI
jgi:hypothetical protein